MKRTTILMALLLASTTAQAERKDAKPWNLGQYMGSVGAVELPSDSSEVSIYRYRNTANSIYVPVKTQKDAERTWFFNFSSQSHIISVSKAFATANKLSIKTTNKRLIPLSGDYKTGGQLQYVSIPELHVGDLVLKNVTAFVSSSKGKFGKTNADLQIGMGAISQLSYAVLNSVGKIQFTQAEKGKDLITTLNGTKSSYDVSGWEEVKFGSKKSIAPATSLIIKTTINEDIFRGVLDTGAPQSSSGWAISASQMQRFYGDTRYDWSTVQWANSQSTHGWVKKDSTYAMGLHEHKAKIGANILSRYDLAVNTQGYELSLKKVMTYQWEDANKAELEYYKSKVQPKEGEEEKAADWMTLGKKYTAIGEHKLAAKAFKKAAVLKSEDCNGWMLQGKAQMRIGEFANAETSFAKASALYHAWWDIDLDDRLSIKKRQSKMEKAAQKERKEKARELLSTGNTDKNIPWHFYQNYVCYKADGYLAYSQIAQGKIDSVEEMYRTKLDLDANLAVAFGNVSLQKGELQKANEAYRQALILESKPTAAHRLGLGLYFADKGEWRFAEPLFQEALQLNRTDALTTYLWLDNARAHSQEKSDNLQRAKQWSTQNPDVAAAHVAYMREAKIAEDQTLFAKLVKKTERFFLIQLSWQSPTVSLIGPYVQYLVLTERYEEADAVLTKYDYLQAEPELLIAQADLKAAKGELDDAKAMLQQAKVNAVGHPGYIFLTKND